MSSTGAIHPAILIILAVLLLVLSAAIVFLRRKRATTRPWRALTAAGQAIRRGVGKRPKLAAFCRAMGRRRWHLAYLFMIAIGAAIWVLSRDTSSETEIAVVSMVATDDAVADAAPHGSFEVEIDPRQLAREDADARRIQQGIALLAVIGVMALVWATASKFATAK